MKYLNLDEDFKPFDGEEINYSGFIFNGGEPHIKLDLEDMRPSNIMITTRITCSDDLIILMLAAEVLRQSGLVEDLYLTLPYFPGARQDRRMVEGEPFTIKVYADLINSMMLDEVVILDPHSDVTGALVNNVTILSNVEFVRQALADIEGEVDEHFTTIVSPDAGAAKKVIKLAQELGIEQVVKCDKDRDVKNGNIKSFNVYAESIKGPCLIVDDICDGGGTFIGLAKALKEKGASKVYLAVTHGIFSKGFKELNQDLDGIYTTDSFPNVDNESFTLRYDNTFHKVKQIKLNEFL
jgi:ribose-phosphate pyrophosphokinase